MKSDLRGNRILMQGASGRYTTAYDPLDRRDEVVAPGNKTITYAYDAASRRRTTIDPDGGRFTYAYDAAGRLTSLRNPQNERTTFSYDDAARRTRKDLANGTFATFTYDAANQMLGVADTHTVTLTSISTTYVYDTFAGTGGTALTSHTPNVDVESGGWVDPFQWDGSNPPTSTSLWKLTGSNSAHFDETSDEFSREGIVIDTGESDLTLDVTFTMGEGDGGSGVYGGATFRFQDDENYWLTGIGTDSSNMWIGYFQSGGYSEATSQALGFTPSPNTQYTLRIVLDGENISVTLGNVTASTQSSLFETETKHGLNSGRNQALDETTTFEMFRAIERTSSLVTTFISNGNYGYDDAGNRVSMREADGARTTWTYDDTNQLLSEHRTGTQAWRNTFTYDAAGNRTLKQEDGTRTTSTYDAANQLIYGETTTGRTTYTFDADGNQRIVEEPNGDRTTNTWDYENRATRILLPDATICTYAYDPDNLRVHIENAAGTTNILFDGQQYLAEMDGSNDITVLYTNEPDEYTNLVSQRKDTESRFLHYDALGSTRAMTDADQEITDTFLYDAWGNRINRTGASHAPFQYVGRFGYFHDPATGTFYVMRRIYEPAIARWWSVDPIWGKHRTNRFVYCQNMPISNIDPSGFLDWNTATGLLPAALQYGFLDQPEESPIPGQPATLKIIGLCGIYTWATKWQLDEKEADGLVIQKVCNRPQDNSVKECVGAKCQPRNFPVTNDQVCATPCYFEAWRIKDGRIYSTRPFDDEPAGETTDFDDIFAFAGCTNGTTTGCTHGTLKKTGIGYFIPSSAITDWNWFKLKFGQGPNKGIKGAGNLASVCEFPSVSRRILDLKTSTGPLKTVIRTWDCCRRGQCAQPPCCKCQFGSLDYQPADK